MALFGATLADDVIGADALMSPPATIASVRTEYLRKHYGGLTDKYWHLMLSGKYSRHKITWDPYYFYSDDKVARLCHAITNADVAAMKDLIRDGANVNAVGKEGMTPLFWAFHQDRDPRPFGILLRHKANPNIIAKIDNRRWKVNTVPTGDAVVHLVSRGLYNRHFKNVFFHNGNPNIRSEWLSGEGETPLNLLNSSAPDYSERMQALIKFGVNFNIRRKKGYFDSSSISEDKIKFGEFGPTYLSEQLLFPGFRQLRQLRNNRKNDISYERAYIALINGADPSLSYSHDKYWRKSEFHYKIMHYVALESKFMQRRPPEERVYFDKVVQWLAGNGYSIEDALDDLQADRPL